MEICSSILRYIYIYVCVAAQYAVYVLYVRVNHTSSHPPGAYPVTKHKQVCMKMSLWGEPVTHWTFPNILLWILMVYRYVFSTAESYDFIRKAYITKMRNDGRRLNSMTAMQQQKLFFSEAYILGMALSALESEEWGLV